MPDPTRYEVIRTGPVWRVLDRWCIGPAICVFTGTEGECAGWVSAKAKDGLTNV